MGATWNSQALFARSPIRHFSKDRYVRRLLRDHDFVILTETHSSAGESLAWHAPPDTTAWWSHGTNARAGVGLILRNSFLQRFHQPSCQWEEIVPGRAAVLRLRGPSGSLDLWAVYFATGIAAELHPQDNAPPALVSTLRQRRHMRLRIAGAASPPGRVLTVIAGDFNWVTDPHDRISKQTADLAPTQDAAEEQHWGAHVATPLRLCELHQSQHTHDSAQARSRLDRVYWNQHIADQLDRRLICAALEWQPGLSAHRAVSFGRRLPVEKAPADRPLCPQAIRHPDWVRRVVARQLSLTAESPVDASPLLHLRLLKDAMRLVTEEIVMESAASSNTHHEHDDPLGWTMRFIRAAELGRRGTMKAALRAYPVLLTITASPLSSSLVSSGRIALYRDHAVQLAREDAINRLQELHQDLPNLDLSEATKRRGHIMQLLRRVSPGRPTHLQAVQLADGSVSTDPDRMATALRSHWAPVFSSRRGHPRLFRQWLEEDLPRHTLAALPPPGDPAWVVTRQDIQRALDRSPNSSPGPDGIPFLAWRTLGPVAATALFEAYQVLSSPRGSDVMLAEYPDFNASDMVFLQKSISGTHDTAGDFCIPEDTRPLNIANTDNRLLANAVRLRLEPVLDAWISPMQRGFLPGRSLLSNVLDVDEGMMTTALAHPAGAALFFDFKAAFPSVLHSFLLGVLRHIGLPPPLCVSWRYFTLPTLVVCFWLAPGFRALNFLAGSARAVPSPPSASQWRRTCSCGASTGCPRSPWSGLTLMTWPWSSVTNPIYPPSPTCSMSTPSCRGCS